MSKLPLRVLFLTGILLNVLVLRGQSTKNRNSDPGAVSAQGSDASRDSAESGLALTSSAVAVPVWIAVATQASVGDSSKQDVWDAAKAEPERPRPKLDPNLGEPPPPPAKPAEPEADVPPAEALKRKT